MSGRARGNDTIGFSFHACKDRWRGVNAPEKLSWLRLCTQEPTTYLDNASSLLWLFRLNSTPPVAIPAAALAAQTLFVQIGPVPPGVVDGDLLACLDSFGNQNDPLYAQPGEFLELAVRVAGVVDESRVVALTSLPDLICLPVRLALHDVHVTQAPRNQSNKLPYRCAPFERTTSYESIITSVWRPKYLDWARILRSAVEIRETPARIHSRIIRLQLSTYGTNERLLRLVGRHFARIGKPPRSYVYDGRIDVLVRKVWVPLEIGNRQGNGAALVFDYPVMSMSVVDSFRRLADE